MSEEKRKPVVFGTITSIPAGLPVSCDYHAIDSAIFCTNNKPLDNPVADYPDIPSLKAAKVPAGRYATCQAYGAVKFGPEEIQS